MTKYRHKPIEVEAFQMKYEPLTNLYWPYWFREALLKEEKTEGWVFLHANGWFMIWTSDGVLNFEEICQNDFVVKEPSGRIFRCSPQEFENNYDLIDVGENQ